MRNGPHQHHIFDAWGMLEVLGRRLSRRPETIEKAIDFALAHPDSNLWFDMEGRIRFAGWLDLGAVGAVCETYKVYTERQPKGEPIQ